MKKLDVKKFNIYILYTIMFLILGIIVFGTFIILGNSFIWNPDGFKQHFVIFQSFHELIRNFGSLSWNTGLGLDVIGQFSYYIIGDPFAYIGLLFPTKYLNVAYHFLILLRIYCIGLAFITYCKYNKKNKYGTLIGALMYTFCGYVLYSSIRHPFFTNAVILLPLMLLGVDKILKEDKYKLFIFTTTLSAISNYYFFYMITILVFIYAIIKYINEYRHNSIKFFLEKFSKTVLAYVIGTLISAIILLPTIYAFMNSARTGTAYTYYDFSYYIKLLFMSSSNLYWTKIYVPSIVLFILPISILNLKKNTENRTILLNLLIETIILLVPFLGSVMNGFSFQSNRWCFAYSFFMSYLVTINLKSNLKYTKKEILCTTIFLVLYCFIAFICRNIAGYFSLISIALAFAILAVILFVNNLKKENSIMHFFFKTALLLIVCCNIILFSWSMYYYSKYSSEFVKFDKIEKQYNNSNGKISNFDKALDYIKSTDNSFYRIGTNIYTSNNLSIKYKYNGLNSYLSIGNKYISELSKDLMILNNTKTNALRELDSRTQITTLLGCKYYVVSKKNQNYVPYGYNLIKEIKNNKKPTYIYENQYSLPIGVFYDNYTLKDDYKDLSPLEKEQILLKTSVIDDSEQIKNYNIKSDKQILDSTSCQELDYNVIDKNNNHNSFKLSFGDVKNCELYILFENLEYHSNDEYSIETKYNKITKKQVIRDKVKSPYYEYTPDILINLGYSENHCGEINISLSGNGKYTYDNIKLIAVPMDAYKSNIENLKKSKFNLDRYDNNHISGTINNQEDGILQISTSYSNGWSAYVDGNKTEIINVNTGFIGIPLNSGEHSVELVYSTPYLKIGIIFSVIGIFTFVIICFRKRIKT